MVWPQQNKWVRVVAGLAALAVVPMAVAPPADADDGGGTVLIYPGAQYQTISGWGTSLSWWAEGTGGWASTTQKNALADALFAPTSGLGLNVIRYNFGAGTPSDACAGHMRVGANVPSFAPTAGSYDWSRDPNQLWMLRAAQARGANRFEGIAYSAPAWMTANNCSAGAARSTPLRDNLTSAHYTAFARYLVTVDQHFHDSWGIPLSTVDPFNEPVQTAWVSNGVQQGMNLSNGARNAVLGDLHTELVNSGANAYTAISASDEYSVSGSITDYNAYNATNQANVAQLNTHDYQAGAEGSRIYALSQRTGKPLWMSEWGAPFPPSTYPDQISAGIALSQHILTDEQQMHPDAWVAWQAVDGPRDGGSLTDLWGLVWADIAPGGNGQLTFPTRYYVMGNYSKFVRPGARMILNTDPNTFTSYEPGNQTLVIVATNPSTSAERRTFDVSNFSATGAEATGYQTTATANLAQLAGTPVTGGRLTVTLPARSVTTYVVPGAAYHGTNAQSEVDDAMTGTGPNRWNYEGGGWRHCSGAACGDSRLLYGGTTSWDETTGDSATLTFTGSRVRLYGVTDTNEGIGAVSVDNGPSAEVDFYSAQRHGNELVWQSPALTPGSHTVKLTVTGRKNPQSTNALPALDRAEVDPAPAGAPESLVGARSTGTLRNNFTGQVGTALTTSAAGLTVTALGRAYVTGNTGTHTVSLRAVGSAAPVATAQLDTSAAPVDGLGFQYATLARPVWLAPNTSYYLTSTESSGGDQFFDADSTITVGHGVTGTKPAWSANGTTWTTYDDPGQTYGPVNLIAG